MNVLNLGGSPHHPGGVETFMERAKHALDRHSQDVRMECLSTSSAYLSFRTFPSYLKQLGKVLTRSRTSVNVIWLQYVNLPDLIFILAAKIRGHQVLITPHLGSNWRSQSNPFLRVISTSLLKLADGIALLSDTQATELSLPPDVRQHRIKTFLPPEMLKQKTVRERSAGRPLTIMHSARLSRGKGTFLFLELCRNLKTNDVRFSAVISGTAEAAVLSEISSAVESLGIADVVEFVGRTNVHEQAALLSSADVLVHLSAIDSYPLIVLEALVCGAYPICINLAGAKQMVGAYDGAIVDEVDAVAQAEEIIMQLDLDKLASRSRSLANQIRSDYSSEQCAAELERVLVASNMGATRRNDARRDFGE